VYAKFRSGALRIKKAFRELITTTRRTRRTTTVAFGDPPSGSKKHYRKGVTADTLQYQVYHDSADFVSFLPARRYASAAARSSTATCLSVCPSVRLSHTGIVPSRAKAGS